MYLLNFDILFLSFRCNKDRIGRECECWKDEVSSEDLEKTCRKDNGTDLCSNNGECVCGKCECKKRDNPEEYYSGEYCECDNFNCDRSNNKLCGGTCCSLTPLRVIEDLSSPYIFYLLRLFLSCARPRSL